jgi:hypothetical protein
MTDSTLSPAAQAVLDAAIDAYWKEFHLGDGCIAAALRAAAYQVEPIEYEVINNLQYEVRSPVRDALLAIATELEHNNA